MNYLDLADRVTGGHRLDRDEALAILQAPDDDLLEILAAAWRVRRAHHGRGVKIHVLENAKSGGCPEDCAFCAQSVAAGAAPIDRYPIEEVEEIVAAGLEAYRKGAWRFCIVTATRGPSERQLEIVCEAARRIRAQTPLRICASLGLLREGQAERLAAAGVDRFNHNIETSERFFPEICSTHTWADRVETVRRAQAAGIEACCGGIVGMGETDEDIVDWIFAVRDLGAASIPVNFLDPRPGTRLAGRPRPTPARCLKILALARLACPEAEIRAAGGREANLRSLQPLALFAANSIFTDGYLTTGGNAPSEDAAMLADAGFYAEPPRRPEGGLGGAAREDAPRQDRRSHPNG